MAKRRKSGISAPQAPVETQEITQNTPNPANADNTGKERLRRIPMSVPTRILEVDPIAGYHLHWFREGKVERAKQAGYELVTPDEVTVNSRGIGADSALGGNTDMGSNVSVVSGEGAGAERLVLMKLKEEWWREDKALLDQRNASVIGGIFEGERVGAPEGGSAPLPEHGYVKQAILNRGPRKAAFTRGQRPG